MLKVAKFGGSSVAGSNQFRKVKAIVEADPARRIVVASAAGKRSSDDHKLTDLLYLCHAHLTYGVSCEEILTTIRERFVEIKNELSLSYDVAADFDAFCAGLSKNISVDELVSRGEYFTSKLLADFLGFDFVDAADCVYFSYDGQIDREKTYAAISAALNEHEKILMPGFYGRLPNGRVKVMTRGGSDISGALAAAAVDADVYENWTDVSGILMADPRIVQNPKPIPKVTYSELQELAFMGASVLHEDSILPVKEKGIPLNIRNTNAPQDAGTFIVDKAEDTEEENDDEHFLTGIAGRRNFDILTLKKHNMNTNITLCEAISIFENFHVTVEHITFGLDSLALVFSASSVGDTIYDIMADIKKACRPDDLSLQEGIALIAAVGRKMTFRPGISGKLFKALGENNVNIRTIAQGADELSIILGVENDFFEHAIRVLYDGFAG